MEIYKMERIMELLPHRSPMLLVEEIKFYEPNRAEGRYFFRGDEWFFNGHYPGMPIVPGILLCEIMAQTGCVLLKEETKGKIPYLITIDNTKFRKIVEPESECKAVVEYENRKGPFHFMAGKLFVEDILCAEGTFSFILKDPLYSEMY